MTITETKTAYVTPSAPVEDAETDIPIVGAVPIHNEPRQRKNSAPAQSSTTTTTVTHIPAPRSSQTTSFPPPGVPDGGTWGSIKKTGGNTWALCAAISFVGCMLTAFPCGIFAFCCPCDDRDAYLVNRKVYDHNGTYLGPVTRFDFRRRSSWLISSSYFACKKLNRQIMWWNSYKFWNNTYYRNDVYMDYIVFILRE